MNTALKSQPRNRQGAILAKVIHSMMVENTGTSMCDSGGESGRMWQRNAGKTLAAFRAEPEVKVEFDIWPHSTAGEQRGQVEATVSTFHFLTQALDAYEAKMTRELHRLGARAKYRDESWLSIGIAFVERLSSAKARFGLIDREATLGDDQGCYPKWINTYNAEDALSQTLQYLLFQYKGHSYVILQIHGGADVRGGYTRPRVFSLSDHPDVLLRDNASFTLTDGYNSWRYEDAGYSLGDVSDAQTGDNDHDALSLIPGNHPERAYPFTKDAALRGDGKHLYVDAAGVGYSPINGEPIRGYIA